jgi:hypothetical protein
MPWKSRPRKALRHGMELAGGDAVPLPVRFTGLLAHQKELLCCIGPQSSS